MSGRYGRGETKRAETKRGETKRGEDEQANRWRAHPAVAFALRLVIFAVPFAAGYGAAEGCIHLLMAQLERSRWWLLVPAVVSLAVCLLVERLTRRLLPLAALLKLSMLFPDRAPSRFKIARKAVSTKTLEKELEQPQAGTASSAAEVVLSLITALTAHDRRTRGHSERVRLFAELLGEQLRLPRDARDRLRWASLLHDIGKLQVAVEILNKPSKLSATEFDLIAQHPATGEQLLGPLVEWLGEWGGAVRQHHEKYDGTGYPDGVAGTADQPSRPDRLHRRLVRGDDRPPRLQEADGHDRGPGRARPLRRHPVRPGVRPGVPVDLAAEAVVGDGPGSLLMNVGAAAHGGRYREQGRHRQHGAGRHRRRVRRRGHRWQRGRRDPGHRHRRRDQPSRHRPADADLIGPSGAGLADDPTDAEPDADSDPSPTPTPTVAGRHRRRPRTPTPTHRRPTPAAPSPAAASGPAVTFTSVPADVIATATAVIGFTADANAATIWCRLDSDRGRRLHRERQSAIPD